MTATAPHRSLETRSLATTRHQGPERGDGAAGAAFWSLDFIVSSHQSLLFEEENTRTDAQAFVQCFFCKEEEAYGFF